MRSRKETILTGFFYDNPSTVLTLVAYGYPDRNGALEAFVDIQSGMDWDTWQSMTMNRFNPDEFFIIDQS